MMRIVIVTTKVPFIKGGAEILAVGLKKALHAHGHEVDMIALPFKGYPADRIPEQMLAAQLFDLSESAGVSIDLMIGLKFPAYFIPHTNKVLWLLHQHRAAYDLWGHPFETLNKMPNGLAVREAIIKADKLEVSKHKKIYTIANNVSRRLKEFCGIDSQPLYHPPAFSESFYCEQPENFLFFPSRLNPIKRQNLVIEALKFVKQDIKIVFAGKADSNAYFVELQKQAKQARVSNKIVWLGQISEEQKRTYYAKSLGVIYPPLDEDYGYVTLEAMLSSKPVITCNDSGGVLEFIKHRENGLIADPNPQALADAMDQLWSQKVQAIHWGLVGLELYHQSNISWNHVVERLVQ